MQKTILIMCTIILIFVLILLNVGVVNESKADSDLFRIHIIANSNSVSDSEVKYKIKDAFTSFLTSSLANCNSKSDVENLIKDNLSNLTAIANTILSDGNFGYKANIKVTNEYFPARVYGDYTVESGYYDGITVTLGQGFGDNWWCVLFPPLCFYNASNNNSNYIVYKSKLLEIIEKTKSRS